MEQLTQFIAQHWQLSAAFVGILILILINELWSQKNNPKMLSPAGVVEYINDKNAIIIDLRPQEAFVSGHITNAMNMQIDDNRIEQYKTKPLILVCAKGLQSNTYANQLKKQGFEEPMVLNGGMNAWTTAGLPTVKGKK